MVEVSQVATPPRRRAPLSAFIGGAAVGVLGGLVGLGGAEFRLPLLIGIFGFAALAGVIVNKAMSLVVVLVALPSRLAAVPLSQLSDHWTAAANILAGSLLGAWIGASWATRIRSATLYRVLAVLLVVIAVVFATERLGTLPALHVDGPFRLVSALIAGFAIGAIAALMGVAGGELLIPTLVLLFALDVKTAGSLSLLISLPTMLVAFFRYSRDRAFAVLRQHQVFVASMAVGSVAGSVVGGLLVKAVPSGVIIPILTGLLLLSAVKVWSHARVDVPAS